jgi:predicted RNA binding protein YcfA (HicA-like mRNA interferase family)
MRGFCHVGPARARLRSEACAGTECLDPLVSARVSARRRSFRGVPKKYREVRAALREAGWEVLRQRGSHEVWGKPGEDARIVVAGKRATLSRWASFLAFAAQAVWSTCDERVRSGL